MRVEQQNMFGTSKMQMNESIRLSIESMKEYGDRYEHWAIAWSGGKDSSALVTFVLWLIDTKQIATPKSLSILYSDTRLELTPLYLSAKSIREEIKEHGYDVTEVMAPMEKRFMCYILGRGVPPPSNTFRWCTGQMKVAPMEKALEELHSSTGQKILMLTGVRQGESAARDGRIIQSCSKDGAECGQGWFQTSLPQAICDTLAPLLHWRVCHVWEWLKHWAPLPEYGDFSTELIADAYGGDEAEEANARTGCIACPLVQKDRALDMILQIPKWKYLQPLKELRPIYRWMRLPANRLRKTGQNSSEKNVQRMGPLTFAAREYAFNKIIDIQTRINEEATKSNSPLISLLNHEEIDFIQQCWKDKVWPNRWDGSEPTGDTIMEQMFPDGTVQKRLFGN